MTAIKCDACGSNTLTVSDDGEFFVCDFCGTKHTKERIQSKIQEIKGAVSVQGSVEVFLGNREKEERLKSAQNLLDGGFYEEAAKTYSELRKLYPDEYRIWFGYMTCMQEGMVEINNVTLEEAYRFAKQLAPEKIKPLIEKRNQLLITAYKYKQHCSIVTKEEQNLSRMIAQKDKAKAILRKKKIFTIVGVASFAIALIVVMLVAILGVILLLASFVIFGLASTEKRVFQSLKNDARLDIDAQRNKTEMLKQEQNSMRIHLNIYRSEYDELLKNTKLE